MAYEFVDSNIKKISGMIMTLANKYNPLTNEIKMSLHAQRQVMYIIETAINEALQVEDDEYDDTKLENIGNAIKNIKDTYAYNYMKQATCHLRYNMTGESEEETMFLIVKQLVEDEFLCTHLAELILLFIQRLAEDIAKFKWDTVSSMTDKQIRTLFRLIDLNTIKPEVFDGIYAYATKRAIK